MQLRRNLRECGIILLLFDEVANSASKRRDLNSKFIPENLLKTYNISEKQVESLKTSFSCITTRTTHLSANNHCQAVPTIAHLL